MLSPIHTNSLRTGSQSAGAFETLIEVQQERFKVVMSRPVRSTTVEAVGKAATFFQSCMDLIAMDRQAHASLVQVLSDLGIYYICIHLELYKGIYRPYQGLCCAFM